jgi:hypothetical protein
MKQKTSKVALADVCIVLGALMAAAGVSVIYWPAALIMSGLSLALFGWRIS